MTLNWRPTGVSKKVCKAYSGVAQRQSRQSWPGRQACSRWPRYARFGNKPQVNLLCTLFNYSESHNSHSLMAFYQNQRIKTRLLGGPQTQIRLPRPRRAGIFWYVQHLARFCQFQSSNLRNKLINAFSSMLKLQIIQDPRPRHASIDITKERHLN